jgi:hypothetical protein
MAEGTIHQDEKMVRRGFYTMKDAVAAWPMRQTTSRSGAFHQVLGVARPR